MIRSMQKILEALFKEQVVNYENLLTVLCAVKRILADRPITPVSNSPKDPELLTPNNLLLLRENHCVPLDVLTKPRKEDTCGKRWRQTQCIANSFWRRWLKDYLPTLKVRQNWTTLHRNFAVGDLVLIVDKKTPRGLWLVDLVEEVYPNSNGKVRRVKVKTASCLCATLESLFSLQLYIPNKKK